MTPDLHLAQLSLATGRVRAALETTDPAAPVPTCPGWDVTALIEHLGGTYLWAREAAQTTSKPAGPPAREDDGRCLVQWYADAAERLLDTLSRLDPGAPAWTFAAGDRTVTFWIRRQLHETLIHAVDLALAGSAHTGIQPCGAHLMFGADSPVDAVVAADGVAEVLEVFLPRMARSVADRVLEIIPAPMVLTATDAGVSWTLRIRDDQLEISEGAASDAAATLAGQGADLDLALWRRADWDTIDRRGDQGIATAFTNGLRLP